VSTGPKGPRASSRNDTDRDGQDLWREVTRTVRPLARGDAPPERLHVAAPLRPAARLVAPPHPAPAARAHAPLADRSPEKRIRRGRVEIGGRLDLHGMTQAEGEAALARFLAHTAAEGARCVLVVTGKGRGERGGVLRAVLPRWLEASRPLVSGYAQAHQKHGGAGAWYVFLRASA
jgi:DNA-nicking Smr family endonuclease